jgi:mono/diheme cytochrome c family protein
MSIVLKLSPNARISKIVPTTFLNMKRGDRLVAAGQVDDEGVFTATTVGINLDFAGQAPPSRSPGRTPDQVAGAARPKPGALAGDSSTEPDAPGAETNATVALGLLQKNCGCHNGSGRGPDLSHEGTRRSATWLKAFIADPRSKNPSSRMPAMAGKVSSLDISVIADYLAKAK